MDYLQNQFIWVISISYSTCDKCDAIWQVV